MTSPDEKTDRPLLSRALFQFLTLCIVLSAITLSLWMYLYGVASVAAAPNSFPATISFQSWVTGLSVPVYVTHAGDNSARLFIVEQSGKIKIFKNNSVLATPFLDLGSSGANRISYSPGSERGLLSVAFPPNYAGKGWFYVYYTDVSGNLAIARYRITANPDVADPNSEQVVLNVPHPINANHNGGLLQFGRDGFLYLGTGDGGSGGDPPNNAQTPSVLLGKILRLNVEPGYNPNPPPPLSFTPAYTVFLPFLTAIVSPPVTYTIPISNPYTFNESIPSGNLGVWLAQPLAIFL